MSNYSQMLPRNSAEAPNFVSRTQGASNIETGVWGGDHSLQEASALQTQKGEFQCIKIDKITALQRGDF